MAYFHPWTLRHQDADEYVPWAGSLRRQDESWEEALQAWLQGNVICLESAQLVSNFLCVHRARPQDKDDSSCENSDDIASDEELALSNESLQSALKTRIWGREDRGNSGDTTSHRDNSTAAMQLGEDVWSTTEGATTDAQPQPDAAAPEELNEIFKAARASQQREKTFKRALQEDPHEATVTERKPESVDAVDTWLDALEARKMKVDARSPMRNSLEVSK